MEVTELQVFSTNKTDDITINLNTSCISTEGEEIKFGESIEQVWMLWYNPGSIHNSPCGLLVILVTFLWYSVLLSWLAPLVLSKTKDDIIEQREIHDETYISCRNVIRLWILMDTTLIK